VFDLSGDGRSDAFDLDGDGRPDEFDLNGDGLRESFDTDGDGRPDQYDFDGDGRADAFDTDGDGRPDAFDVDGDGRVDALDTDGDGRPDTLDADGDGRPDAPTAAVEPDAIDDPETQIDEPDDPAAVDVNNDNANDDNDSDSRSGDDGSPFEALGPLLLVGIVVAVVAALAWAFFNRPARTASKLNDEDEQDPFADPAEAPVDYSVEINALDQLLWEVEQEPDPRRAIRRVYAALETGLGNPDMARRRSETPGIYLNRILGRFDELQHPLGELTLLFEQARFSEHEITHEMRNRAIQILVQVREHYSVAAAQAPPPPPAPVMS